MMFNVTLFVTVCATTITALFVTSTEFAYRIVSILAAATDMNQAVLILLVPLVSFVIACLGGVVVAIQTYKALRG